MCNQELFRSVVLAAAAIWASQASHAVQLSGTFNDRGYDVFTLDVSSTSVVDFRATDGYLDPTISLFDSAGKHLISNDDSVGLFYHLTQTLGSDRYSVLISYCCQSIQLTSTGGATLSNTDGFNFGSYWIGGEATLVSMQEGLDAAAFNLGGTPYALSVTVSAVPEPATYALYGLGLTGLALARRRRA